MAAADIAKQVGCTVGLVYNVKSRLGSGSRAPGRPRKNPRESNSLDGLDSILSAVQSTHAEVGRYRTALERIGSMLRETLA
jgi:hypothetical protein